MDLAVAGWRSERRGDAFSDQPEAIYLLLRGGMFVYAGPPDQIEGTAARISEVYGSDEHEHLIEDLLGQSEELFRSPGSGNLLNTYIALQDDGNLVMYRGTPDTGGEPEWSSLVDLDTRDEQQVVTDVKKTWLEVADYDHMSIGASKVLLYMGGDRYVAAQGNKVDPQTSPIDIAEVYSGVKVTKNLLGPTFSVIAATSIIHAATTGENDLSSCDFTLFTADAQAQISNTYIGAGAKLALIDAQVSVFNLTLGLGADTGIGIKDDSVTVKLLGTGLQVGRVVGIGVFGTSFGVDFGRVFNSIF